MVSYQYGKTEMGDVTCSICFEPFIRAMDIYVEYNICNIFWRKKPNWIQHLIHKICIANKLLRLLTGKIVCYQYGKSIKHGQLWKILFKTADEIYNFDERMKKIDWKSSNENIESCNFRQVWKSLGMADVTCTICLEPMTPECDISETPCMHLFHTICIKNKLQKPIFRNFGLNFPSQLKRIYFRTPSAINYFNERTKRMDSDKKSRDTRPHTRAFSKNIYFQKLNLEKWSKTFLKLELDMMNQAYQARIVLADLKLIGPEEDFKFEDLKKFDKNILEAFERLKIKWKQQAQAGQEAQTAQEAQAGQAVHGIKINNRESA